MTKRIAHNKYWTKEKCKEDALRFNSRNEWNKKSKAAYMAAWRNGWLDECCAHMQTFSKPMGWWTKERCIADALLYKSRSEWNKNSDGYQIARKNGWLSDCCKHMVRLQKPNGYWSKKQCEKDALRFETKVQWEKGSPSGYNVALRNKWIDDCCKHMIEVKKPNGYWIKERCKEDASRHPSKSEWMNESGGGYQAAHENGWIEECCKHMKNEGGSSRPERELFSIIKEKYPDAIKKRFVDPINKSKRFDLDVYIPSLNVGIEFNGGYWHSFEGLKRGRKTWSDEDIKNYHPTKRTFFENIKIKYLEIDESDWKNNKQECIDRCLNFIAQSIKIV